MLHGLAQTDHDQNDSRSTGRKPLAVDLFYVLDMNLIGGRLFEDDGGEFGNDSKVSSSSKGKGGTKIRMPIWKPLLTFSLGSLPLARSQKNCPMDVIMPACWMLIVGYPRGRGEFERIDAVMIDDPVYVDVSDVAFLRKLRLHLQ